MQDVQDVQDLESFIHHLPKIELHVHIEGTLLCSRRWSLAQKNNIPIPGYPTYESLQASYNVVYNHRKKLRGDNGAPTFFDAYYGGIQVLRTEDDFYQLAMDYFRKAHDMNVRYVEPFFDPQAHTRRGVAMDVVMTGLQRATLDAESLLGVRSNWIMCFLRDMSPESAMEHYNAALPYLNQLINVVAVGMDGDEYDRPPTLFLDLFDAARRDGLKITCHCDVFQKDTHEHIRQVLCEIGGTGADRIDHGINVADKPELIKLVRGKGGAFGMTMCPHAYSRHEPPDAVFPKIRELFDQGIKLSINSDDPTYMHQKWVEENLCLVAKQCPFSKAELVRLQRNALDMCWASEHVKAALSKELDEFESALP